MNDKHNISCFFCIRVLKKKLTKHSPAYSDKSVLEPMTTKNDYKDRKNSPELKMLERQSNATNEDCGSLEYRYPLSNICSYSNGCEENESNDLANAITMKDRSTNAKSSSVIGSGYTCFICMKTFELEQRFRVHQLAKHGEKEVCIICGKECKNNLVLRQHWDQKHKGRSDNCPTCGTELKSNFPLQMYVNNQSTETTKCIICLETPLCPGRSSQHMNSMHSQCIICDKSCGSYRNRQRHMDAAHNVTCFVCAQDLRKNMDALEQQLASRSEHTQLSLPATSTSIPSATQLDHECCTITSNAETEVEAATHSSKSTKADNDFSVKSAPHPLPLTITYHHQINLDSPQHRQEDKGPILSGTNSNEENSVRKVAVDRLERDDGISKRAGKVKCIVCDKMVENIYAHMNAKHSKCTICAKNCGSYRQVQAHMLYEKSLRSKGNKHKLTCCICFKTCKSNQELSHHNTEFNHQLNNQFSGRKYVMGRCLRRSQRRGFTREEVKSMFFARSPQFTALRRPTSRTNVYNCSICVMCFPNKGGLISHNIAKHEEEKTISLKENIRNRMSKFLRRGQRRGFTREEVNNMFLVRFLHPSQATAPQKLNNCAICAKNFSTKEGLNSHNFAKHKEKWDETMRYRMSKFLRRSQRRGFTKEESCSMFFVHYPQFASHRQSLFSKKQSFHVTCTKKFSTKKGANSQNTATHRATLGTTKRKNPTSMKS